MPIRFVQLANRDPLWMHDVMVLVVVVVFFLVGVINYPVQIVLPLATACKTVYVWREMGVELSLLILIIPIAVATSFRIPTVNWLVKHASIIVREDARPPRLRDVIVVRVLISLTQLGNNALTAVLTIAVRVNGLVPAPAMALTVVAMILVRVRNAQHRLTMCATKRLVSAPNQRAQQEQSASTRPSLITQHAEATSTVKADLVLSIQMLIQLMFRLSLFLLSSLCSEPCSSCYKGTGAGLFLFFSWSAPES